MITTSNSYLGMPARLYRTPRQIYDDISELKARITEVNDTLCVHDLLMEFMSEWADKEPERWIGELEEIVESAKDALAELGELNEAIEELRGEMEETRWALGL